MAAAQAWRLEATSDGTTLRCRRGPDDPRPLEISWSGPAGAAYAEFEPLTEWLTREYTATCDCMVRVYAADGTRLGEFKQTLSD